MRLLRLHVENFGVLQDYRLELLSGQNVLHAENGWGKSTLAVFIKAMLYGLPLTSRRSLDENERKKYTPWQGGAFGGSLEFQSGKGSFRVERFFAPKESGDSFALYDLSTNKLSDAYSERLGEELFGIDADGFERTVYLSQRGVLSKGENTSIAAKLGNLLDDVSDIGSYDDAMELLEKRRRYYVLTGGRGRIAELEQERADCRAELEGLLEIRTALERKEEELSSCRQELQGLQKELETVRADLQKAGLLREREALLEQKERMLGELAALDAQKRKIDAFFDGNHPTEEELAEKRALLTQIREAKARLDAIPAGAVRAEPCELLSVGSSIGLPDAEQLNRWARENTALQNLCHRERGLREQKQAIVGMRLSNGVPTDAEQNAAFATLEQAKKLQKEADGLEHGRVQRKLPAASVLLGAIGVILAAVSFLPALAGLASVLMLAAGCVLAVGAVIVCAVVLSAQKRKNRELERRAAECRQNAKRSFGRVEEFLVSYGIDPKGDLERGLTELALLSRQQREAQQREAAVSAELAALAARKQSVLGVLQQSLRSFGVALPAKEDYRDEIEALRRDRERILRAERAETERKCARAVAEEEYERLKRELLPFLRRFDAGRKLQASECIQAVAESEREYRRLCAEETRKKEELHRFLQEKKLDASAAEAERFDYGALIAREKELHLRVAELQDTQAALNNRIAHLSEESDRIPEVEARLGRTEETLAEARANGDTVANTLKLLSEAKTALSTRYLSDMQESFQRFLAILTEGEPPESVMDTSFEVSLRAGGKTHPMESFSRGWRDAVQFCIRLSLTEALYREGEAPFLLLDDPFVNLDDRRLSAARALVEKLAERYQIIYTVCHADRK